MWRFQLRSTWGVLCLSLLASLALLAGCGASAGTPRPTPTATLLPSPTPSPTVTPSPTAIPSPTATPFPSACAPAPGVQPVSSVAFGSFTTSSRDVVLTFDSDGGNPGNATAYLDILAAHGIHASWFLTGDFARANPSIVRRLVSQGQDIGNHTVDHPDLISPARSDSFVCSELTQANSIIAGVTGRTTRPYFRPPYGDYNTQTRSLAARLGYRTILWNIDPRDWDSTTTVQDILNRVLGSPNLRPGAIILMHVNSPNERYALDQVITGLQQRGYAIVPLSHFIG